MLEASSKLSLHHSATRTSGGEIDSTSSHRYFGILSLRWCLSYGTLANGILHTCRP